MFLTLVITVEKSSPRNTTERIRAMFSYNNHFCLVWKSEGVTFDKAVEELISKFINVDNCLSQDNVSGYFGYIYKSKKVENQLSNFLVFDIEANIDKNKTTF